MPGLTLTIPTGWFASEQDAGEFSLHPEDHPDDQLVFWKDVIAVVSNHRTQPADTPVAHVGPTASDLMHWFATDPDYGVLSKPTAAAVGHGISGTSISLGVSPTANYGDAGCPSNPHCVDLVTDPAHWGANFFGFGAPETVRIFISTIHAPDGDHTFLVVLDAPSPTELQRFANQAQPILDSITLPAVFYGN